MNEQFPDIPLDPFSEYAMASEADDYPKTDFTQMQFEGKIDFAALSEAYYDAIALVPIFNSFLVEEREGLLYQPRWVFNREVQNRLHFADCRHMVNEPFEPMAFTTEFYRMRVLRRFDLEREFPFQCTLIQVGDRKYIFSILYHHSALDPARAYIFLTKMLASYHEKVKGEKPEWDKSIGMAALDRKGGLAIPASWPKFIGDQVTDIWWTNRAGVVANVATENILDFREEKGRHSLRAVIDDPKLMKGLLDRAKRNESTFNDLVFAAARKVITKWNEDRGVSAEKFRFMLITSLIGRMELPTGAGAGLSGLNLVTALGETRDLDQATKVFKSIRTLQLNEGTDVMLYRMACKLLGGLRIFPRRMRNKMLHPLSYSSPITFYISNLGVVWPKYVDGRPTADSSVLGAGDFVINDFHSSASVARSIGTGVTIRSHNHKTYFNFVADRFRFRDHEIKMLVDSIMAELINAA